MDNTPQEVKKKFTPSDYFKITILGLGISAFGSSMNSLVLPVRLLDLVPETLKNTYLGNMTFAGLMIAMITQPIIGRLSDRSRFAWGRRRPFILIGILLGIILLPGIGFWESYTIIFVNWCLLQIATNTAQAPYQSFIPDMAPEEKVGSASGIKTMMEFTGSLIIVRLVAFFMDRYTPGDSQFWLWVTLGILAAFLFVPMVITIIMVKERAASGGPTEPLLSGFYKSFHIDLKQKRDFMWFLVSRGLMSLPGTALSTFFFYYVRDIFNPPNPAGMSANVFIVVGLSLIITAAMTGRLTDRFGRKPVLVSCGFAGALGILFLFLSQNQIHMMLAGFVIGVANGAFWSASWAQASDLLPADESARYMGLVNLASVAGSGLGRLIGRVIDFFNSVSPNFGYSVMLIIGSVCYLAGSLIILSKVKESKRFDQQL